MNEKLFELTAEQAEMLERENAIKLEQILDLEQTLWDTRIMNDLDGSPCWCCNVIDEDNHDEICNRARKATEPFWKGVKRNEQSN